MYSVRQREMWGREGLAGERDSVCAADAGEQVQSGAEQSIVYVFGGQPAQHSTTTFSHSRTRSLFRKDTGKGERHRRIV